MQVGLHMNSAKTKCMKFNQDHVQLKTQDDSQLEIVDDFKYLGSWVKSSEQDVKVRKAMAWKACNKLSKIWQSRLSRNVKIRLFQTTVESVLLYGAETWTVTSKLGKVLDGCYTRLLRTALNISWKSHTTNQELYGQLPRITTTIQRRRLQFAGHCKRSSNQPVADLILWQPTQGKRKAGRPSTTYVDVLCSDTQLRPNEMQNCMTERPQWRAITKVRQKSTE